MRPFAEASLSLLTHFICSAMAYQSLNRSSNQYYNHSIPNLPFRQVTNMATTDEKVADDVMAAGGDDDNDEVRSNKAI